MTADLPGMIARIVTASAYSKSSVPSSSPARTLAILEMLPDSEISLRSAMNALRGIFPPQLLLCAGESTDSMEKVFLGEIQAKASRFKVRRGSIQRKRFGTSILTDIIANTWIHLDIDADHA